MVSNQKLFVFIFNEAGEHASTEMDGNEGTLTWKPCETHQNGHRLCNPKNCKNGKWVRVESKRTACDDCVKSRKKCTHGLAGKTEAPVKRKREPDLSTFQKPAGKTKRAKEAPVPSIAPEKTVSGFGWMYTLKHPGGKLVSFDEIEDPKVLLLMKMYGAYQEPELVEKYRLEEEALEDSYFRKGLRKLLREDYPVEPESVVTGPSVEAKVQKEELDLDNLPTREWEVMFFDEQDVPVDRDLC